MTRQPLYQGIDCDQGKRKEFLKRNKFQEITESLISLNKLTRSTFRDISIFVAIKNRIIRIVKKLLDFEGNDFER